MPPVGTLSGSIASTSGGSSSLSQLKPARSTNAPPAAGSIPRSMRPQSSCLTKLSLGPVLPAGSQAPGVSRRSTPPFTRARMPMVAAAKTSVSPENRSKLPFAASNSSRVSPLSNPIFPSYWYTCHSPQPPPRGGRAHLHRAVGRAGNVREVDVDLHDVKTRELEPARRDPDGQAATEPRDFFRLETDSIKKPHRFYVFARAEVGVDRDVDPVSVDPLQRFGGRLLDAVLAHLLLGYDLCPALFELQVGPPELGHALRFALCRQAPRVVGGSYDHDIAGRDQFPLDDACQPGAAVIAHGGYATGVRSFRRGDYSIRRLSTGRRLPDRRRYGVEMVVEDDERRLCRVGSAYRVEDAACQGVVDADEEWRERQHHLPHELAQPRRHDHAAPGIQELAVEKDVHHVQRVQPGPRGHPRLELEPPDRDEPICARELARQQVVRVARNGLVDDALSQRVQVPELHR